MKLIHIRLHPFGGTSNRTCAFNNGLNVLVAPNEFGKSTLVNALWHGLFTPTNLTPANLKKTIGRWYPKPNGDHVKITLKFIADGDEWMLDKTWGSGAASLLKSDKSAPIADPTRVHDKLLELLRRNEATWRNVLFVGQAQLNRTIQDLRDNGKNIDEIYPLIAGADAITGDIAQDKLETGVANRIEEHFRRWDRNIGGPEKGRGIENPWVNKVGSLLSAYYVKELARKEFQQVLDHEKQVDNINEKIRELELTINDNREFVAIGRNLRDGLGRRNGLEERIKSVQNDQTTLREVLVEWPGAKQVIITKQAELERVIKTIVDLDQELADARKRENAGQLRKNHELLVTARNEWAKAVEKLKYSQAIPSELLEELNKAERKIEELRIQIAAQKLNARMESKTSMTVTVTRGTNAPDIIELKPGVAWESLIDGKLCLELADARIEVASETGDVFTLFHQLDKKVQRQKEILETLRQPNRTSAVEADKNHQGLVVAESRSNQIYQTALQGKTEEEWTAEIASLDALPQTRSVSSLETVRNVELNKKARLEIEINQTQEKVATWVAVHSNLDTLTLKIIAKTSELMGATTELGGLPLLPAGFDSIRTYLNCLSQKEDEETKAISILNGLKIDKATLMGVSPARTAEELREEAEFKDRAYCRQIEVGEMLLRIQAKLKNVISVRGVNEPLNGLSSMVSRYFNKLTNARYDDVKFDRVAPMEINGPVNLETGLLSQGTLGSLALATRLALADLYLKGMDGFLLLDDPFTDMDPSRRSAAESCLGESAKYRQIMIFTCHPEHAQELKELAGAKTPIIEA